ncbi:MAG: hypothetical protein QUS33_00185 [Dehalococcoidia bacterium]|nr:hypothetical protein [Dehalococcoidia bacterium]
MSRGKIALLVFGIIFLVGAVVLMAGGSGLMWLSVRLKNDDPLFTSRETRLRSASAYAVVTEPFDIDWYGETRGQSWGLGNTVSVILEAENRDPSKGVFIGIARETDVDDYLSGVRYSEIVEWTSNPFDDPEVEYRHHPGTLVPSDPRSQTFWDASAHGPGRQTIEWSPAMGRWVLVIMNEDASPGIDVSGAIGAQLPWLFWLGLGLLVSGVLALAGGIVMICLAARGPRRAPALTQPTR